MVCRLIKFLFLLIIILSFFSFETKQTNRSDNVTDNKSDNFFDIFSPSNLSGINVKNNSKNEISKIKEFTLYGIINTKNVKAVIIKPKRITSEIRELRNRRGYIILHLKDKIYKYELVKIEKNIAFFKKDEKILKLSVFNEEKKDRVRVASKTNGPKVIAQPPSGAINPFIKNVVNKKTLSKNKKGKVVIFNKKNKKKIFNKKSSNIIKHKTGKKNIKNPFLELLERAKKNNKNSVAPPENPFLKLLRNR